jgi:hypothetical protein
LENAYDFDYLVFENIENLQTNDLNKLQNLLTKMSVVILTNDKYGLQQKFGNLLKNFTVV